MNIYRGPGSKHISEEEHQRVASININPKGQRWQGQILYEANLTKDGYNKKSVATVAIRPEDIMGLMHGMLMGWQGQMNDSDHLSREINRLRDSLNCLYDYANSRGCNNVKGYRY